MDKGNDLRHEWSQSKGFEEKEWLRFGEKDW
jgi:hypothetical protein